MLDLVQIHGPRWSHKSMNLEWRLENNALSLCWNSSRIYCPRGKPLVQAGGRGVLRVAAKAPLWDVEPKSQWTGLTWNPKLLQALLRLDQFHKHTLGNGDCEVFERLFLKTCPFALCFRIAFLPFVIFWCFSEISFKRKNFQLPGKNKTKRGNFWFITFSKQQKKSFM